jgi:CrcB protein
MAKYSVFRLTRRKGISQKPRAAQFKRKTSVSAGGLMDSSALLRSLACISLGASCGASLRWLLGLGLNALFPLIPPGTLTANLLGGYLMGLALCAFPAFPSLGPEWRLLFVTGFLGSLTTFSAFSGETVLLLTQQRIFTALAAIAFHVIGSLSMTALGMISFPWIKNVFS